MHMAVRDSLTGCDTTVIPMLEACTVASRWRAIARASLMSWWQARISAVPNSKNSGAWPV